MLLSISRAHLNRSVSRTISSSSYTTLCRPVSKLSGNRNQSFLQQSIRTYASMSALKAGDKFPDGVVFSYVPYNPESESITACGMPINYKASEEWKDKKVVLFAVPGAFTPGCSANHLPPYIKHLDAIKSKGVDVIAVIAYNDAFVMNAWSKANGIKNDDILFMCDVDTKFSKSIGWVQGERTNRYAMIIDNGTVSYAEKEPARGVTVSGAEAIMSKL